MKNKILFGLLVLVTVAALLFGACAPAPAPAPAPTPTPTPAPTPTPTPTPAPKTLQIGYIDGLTGLFSNNTICSEEGALIAADVINNQGGLTINGQKYLIEVVTEDGKNTAEGTAAAATKLVYDKNLKFIGGGCMPFIAIAISGVTDPAKVLHSQPYNSALYVELGPKTPYTFQCRTGSLENGEVGISYLLSNYPQVKSMSIAMCAVGAEDYIYPPIKSFAEKNGIASLGYVLYPHDIVDYTPLAVKIKALNADAVMMPFGWSELVGSFLKAFREQGSDQVVFGGNLCDMGYIKEAAGSPADTNSFFVGFSVRKGEALPPLLDKMPVLKEMIQRSFDKYGHANPFTMEGFDCIYSIVYAIEKAQSLDPTVVRDTWEKLDSIETACGTAPMGGMIDYGIRHVAYTPVPLQVLTGGVITHVEVVDPSKIYKP